MDLANFEQWNKEVEMVKKQNQTVLDTFNEWLNAQSVPEGDIKQFIADISFFAQTFLILNEAIPVEKGMSHIDEYLGDFFIREVPWASPETIEGNEKSFLKFYSFLLNTQQISQDDFTYLQHVLSSESDKWVKNYHLYNSSCEF